MFMHKLIYFLFFNIFFINPIYSQLPGYNKFNLKNGLPSNTIYDITQDEHGFIWLATDYGLSKFDGLNFTNYTIDDGLPDNEILYFFKDSTNRIWLVGFNGDVGYIKNEQFYNSKNTPFLNELKFNTFVSSIFEDSSKSIWFLQSRNQIKKIDSLYTISNYKVPSISKQIVAKNLFLIEDKNKNINVFNSKKHLQNKNLNYQLSIKHQKWEQFNLKDYTEKNLKKLRKYKTEPLRYIDSISGKISNIIHQQFKYPLKANLLYRNSKIDKNTYLVTNLDEGALLLNFENSKEVTIKLLPTIETTNSFVDLENNIWIGSKSNGVFLFPNIHINGIQFDKNKRNDLQTVSLYNSNIVLGNELGEIVIIDKKKLNTKKIFKLNQISERTRHLKEHNNNLYILSDIDIYALKTDLSIKLIKDIYEDSYQKTDLKNFKDITFDDHFIYSANSNGIAKINSKSLATKRLWNKRCSSILSISNDSIWAGTTNGLYLSINSKIEKFNLNESFNKTIIYALKKTNNTLLIGSNSYGLGMLSSNGFKSISKKNGLLSNYIKSITVDTKNNIWLSTNFGLNCLTLDEKGAISSIKSYTTSDGLYSNDVRGCTIDNEDNKVYVATSEGLNIIDLTKECACIIEPKIHLNEVLVNNSPIDKTNNQKFKYTDNNIQFNFSGISFKSLGNVLFKYRLNGIEEEWISTKNTTVRYSSLPPNTYTFEVISISKNNIENKKPLQFTFTISPAFHQTWWFKIIDLFLISGIIFGMFYLKNKRLKKELAVKEKISALHYRALNAQMNPHFINNLIVNINDLANKGDLDSVQGSLGKFGELVNLVLRTTKSNLISINDELKMSTLYLDLEKQRFHKKLNYTINFNGVPEDEFDHILVPPMILQPLIENSIKHGFKNHFNNNHIDISFKIENDDFLICEIKDNGCGIHKTYPPQQSNDSGISLKNINKRLQLITENHLKENFVLTTNITDEFNNLVGSKIKLKIPLISY